MLPPPVMLERERVVTDGGVEVAGGVAIERTFPSAVLKPPVELLRSALAPLAVLRLPVVLLASD